MLQRGFSEAQEELRSEREHADQLRRLADSSVAINASLSIGQMLQALTRHARLVIGADCCIAGIIAADGSAPKVAISRSPDNPGWDRLTQEPHPSEVHALVSRLGRPKRMDKGLMPEGFSFPDEDGARLTDFLAAPITSHGRHCVGFILLADRSEGKFTGKDMVISIQLAETVSAAIDNALLYERERRVAEMLQRGLLPNGLPDLRGLAVSARYLPGAAGLNVGGDWYDVFSLPEGRTGVAIGDVIGRGVKAATVMGQIRTAFRAYSLIEGSPEKVVARLDCLMSDLDPEHFSTMIYLVWDPAEGTARTVVAGHPPPLLIDAAGQAEFLGGDVSVPLGTMAGFPYRHLRTSVENGSTLVLYTDGLVEQEGGVEKGLANLKRAASYPADSPDELCDRLLKSMLPADSEDDVAIVVLRFLAE
jgi:hypothetical protein